VVVVAEAEAEVVAVAEEAVEAAVEAGLGRAEEKEVTAQSPVLKLIYYRHLVPCSMWPNLSQRGLFGNLSVLNGKISLGNSWMLSQLTRSANYD